MFDVSYSMTAADAMIHGFCLWFYLTGFGPLGALVMSDSQLGSKRVSYHVL